MRNKNTLKYAISLAFALPFLVFTVVLAEHEGEETNSDPDHEETTTTETENTNTSNKPFRSVNVERPVPSATLNAEQKARMEKIELERAKTTNSMNADRDLQAREGLKENMEKMREQRISMMKKLMSMQIARAQTAIDRMQALIERISSRRTKLVAEGANLTSVDALIVKAKIQKAEAQTALDKAKSDLAALQGSENPRQAVQTFMASMKTLREKITQLHKTLGEIIMAMRKSMPKPEAEASVETKTTINP